MIRDQTVDHELRQRLKKEQREARAKWQEALTKDPRVVAAKRAQKERRHAAYQAAKKRRQELVRGQKAKRQEVEAQARGERDAAIRGAVTKLATSTPPAPTASTASTASTAVIEPAPVSNVIVFPTARSKRIDPASR